MRVRVRVRVLVCVRVCENERYDFVREKMGERVRKMGENKSENGR